MRGYQTLIDAADLVSGAMMLVNDADIFAIKNAARAMDECRSRRQFEKEALRFDRAFHGLVHSGYATVGD